MTKQEIKEAIAKGIAGQGTNVDGGGGIFLKSWRQS